MLRILVLSLLCFSQASADTITFLLDQPIVSASPGDVISFTGTLENSGTATLFLNGALGTLPYVDFLVDYGPFFSAVPASLAPGEIYSGEIFGVAVGLGAAPGDYFGAFTIQGGPDSFTFDDMSTHSFQITVTTVNGVPEPSSGVLALSAIALVFLSRRIPVLRH